MSANGMRKPNEGYLACPEKGVALHIGEPTTSSVMGYRFTYDYLIPVTVPIRRVFFQALSRLLTDSPARGMFIELGSSTALAGLREIGGPVESGGLPVDEYLGDQPVEWVTYFATRSARLRSGPGGVVRRREILGRSTAEYEMFTRRMRWEPTEHVPGHAEISEGEAVQFVLDQLARKVSVGFVRLPWE